MFQNLITGLIIIFVFGITIHRIIGYFRNPLKGCEGCGSQCGSCSLGELKREIDEKNENRNRLAVKNLSKASK